MSKYYKDMIIVIISITIVVSTFLYFEIKRADDIPIADETQFSEMTETITTIGKPICHFHGKLDVYTTHPPLYPYFLTVFKFGGIISMRLSGVFLYIIASIFALYLPRTFGIKPNLYYYIFGLAFMLLPPIALSGAGLIDIDTGLLPIMIILSLSSLIKLTSQNKWHWFIISMTAVMLAGLTKLTTSMSLLPIALLIPLIMKRGFKIKPFLVALVGLSLATSLYIIINRTYFLVGVETIITKLNPTISTTEILRHITVLIFWFSPYLFITFIFSTVFRQRQISNPLKVYLLLGLIIFITYIFIGGTGYGFPKYHFAVLPLIMPSIALIVSKEIINIERRTLSVVFIGGLLSLLCGLLIGDYLLLPYISNDDMVMGYKSIGEIRAGLIYQTLIMIIPLLVPVYFLVVKRREFLFSISIVSILFLVPQVYYMSVADYQVRYNYGERGFDKVIQLTKIIYKEGSDLIVPDDIAYNIGIVRDYEETTFYLNRANLFVAMSEYNNLYVIMRSAYVNNKLWQVDSRKVLGLVGKNYGIARVGHFMIFIPIRG
ncbi:MAG: hypothetical protein ACUVWP_06695 [bacterium]